MLLAGSEGIVPWGRRQGPLNEAWINYVRRGKARSDVARDAAASTEQYYDMKLYQIKKPKRKDPLCELPLKAALLTEFWT
jgi:hypothetical protein